MYSRFLIDPTGSASDLAMPCDSASRTSNGRVRPLFPILLLLMAFPGHHLAKISDMGWMGNLLSLTRYKNDEISYIEYLDDRGFISGRIYCNEENPVSEVSEF